MRALEEYHQKQFIRLAANKASPVIHAATTERLSRARRLNLKDCCSSSNRLNFCPASGKMQRLITRVIA